MLLSLFLLLFSGIAGAPPNFVVVLVDDLGYADVGFGCAHKDDCVTTPVLDRLNKEGLSLTQFYVQPLCSPSRSALFTGKYPIHTGMQTHVLQPSQPRGLPLHHKLFPQALQEANYHTALIGKYHLGYSTWGYTPTHRGFDYFYGQYVGAADHYTHMVSLANYSTNPFLNKFLNGIDFHRNTDHIEPPTGVHSTDLYFNEGMAYLDGVKDSKKPFYLQISLQAIHDPIQTPQEYVHRNLHLVDQSRQQIAGMVTHIDVCMEKLVARLKQNDQWENTLLFFFSDNGGVSYMGSSNAPLKGQKGSVYEGAIKSQAFISGGYLPTPGECNQMIHLVDFYPTFINLATSGGGPQENGVDGLDFWPMIKAGCVEPSRTEFVVNIDPVGYPLNPNSYYPLDALRYKLAGKLGWGDNVKAYRSGHMKLIVGLAGASILPEEGHVYRLEHYEQEQAKIWWESDEPLQLYNITNDPGERNNVANDPKYAGFITEILRKLEKYERSMVSPVNIDGIMRSKQAFDFLEYFPLRCGGFVVPFRENPDKCFGIWFSVVVLLVFLFVIFVVVPCLVIVGIRKIGG